MLLANIKAPKNGYVYVYLSNESDEPVYFDNLQVGLNRGKIIEEDHYYAFGLKIAAISSQKLGDPNEGNIDNKNLYNDKELFDDADLDWYDYGFRNYDAQIGRFAQLDPLTNDYPPLTLYQYASNDPILNIDLDGLEGFNAAFTEIGTAANVLPGVTVTATAAKVLKSVTVAAKTLAPNVITSAFKSIMKAVPAGLGAIAGLIPDNTTGANIAGSIIGVGEAGRDAVVGAYNMVRHPINTFDGMAQMATMSGQVKAASNIAENYVQSESEFGEGFTNSRYISYGITMLGIAAAAPEMVKGVNQFAAESYVSLTGKAGSFSSVEGFSFRMGTNDFAYHNSLEAAASTKWSTSTSFNSSSQAFNALALDYPKSTNFAQIKFSLKNYGLFVEGTASPQGTTLGGGTQLLKTSFSLKTRIRRVPF